MNLRFSILNLTISIAWLKRTKHPDGDDWLLFHLCFGRREETTWSRLWSIDWMYDRLGRGFNVSIYTKGDYYVSEGKK